MPQGLKPGNSDELVWLKGGMVMKDFLLSGTHKQPPHPSIHSGSFPGVHQANGRSHVESLLRESKG